jgi:hypothetical protein
MTGYQIYIPGNSCSQRKKKKKKKKKKKRIEHRTRPGVGEEKKM